MEPIIGNGLLFTFSLFEGASMLFLAVYVIITLSDLECDYINAQNCCSKLNKVVIPEIACNVALTGLLFITFHWILFFLSLPMTCYMVYSLLNKPSGYIGLYDPAEIHNRQQLKGYMKEAMIKLGYYLVFFFIYLYSLIVTLLDDS